MLTAMTAALNSANENTQLRERSKRGRLQLLRICGRSRLRVACPVEPRLARFSGGTRPGTFYA